LCYSTDLYLTPLLIFSARSFQITALLKAVDEALTQAIGQLAKAVAVVRARCVPSGKGAQSVESSGNPLPSFALF
jgi:hypothetical protein